MAIFIKDSLENALLRARDDLEPYINKVDLEEEGYDPDEAKALIQELVDYKTMLDKVGSSEEAFKSFLAPLACTLMDGQQKIRTGYGTKSREGVIDLIYRELFGGPK